MNNVEDAWHAVLPLGGDQGDLPALGPGDLPYIYFDDPPPVQLPLDAYDGAWLVPDFGPGPIAGPFYLGGPAYFGFDNPMFN